MIRFWKLCALLVGAIIAVLSLQSPGDVESFGHADKVQHFAAYAGLCGLACLGWPRRHLWQLVALVTLFGMSIEIGQGAMGLGRQASALDGLANFAGAVTAAIVFRFIRK